MHYSPNRDNAMEQEPLNYQPEEEEKPFQETQNQNHVQNANQNFDEEIREVGTVGEPPQIEKVVSNVSPMKEVAMKDSNVNSIPKNPLI